MEPIETTSIVGSDLEVTVQTLQTIAGPARVSIAQADRTQHARDQSSHAERLPDVVIWPQTTAEVSAILAYANEARRLATENAEYYRHELAKRRAALRESQASESRSTTDAE